MVKNRSNKVLQVIKNQGGELSFAELLLLTRLPGDQLKVAIDYLVVQNKVKTRVDRGIDMVVLNKFVFFQSWPFHNIIAHSLAEFLSWFGFKELASKIHNGTLPAPETEPYPGSEYLKNYHEE